jgi:predicted SAM-dependent methyltransferase
MTIKQKLGQLVIPRLPFSRRVFDILRFEAGSLRQRLTNLLSPVYHRKVKALQTMSGISVNFGSGGRGLPEWINIDVRPHHEDQYIAFDLRRPLPFRDASVKRILAEHVIEHLDFRDEVPGVFREFHRILSPDGTVRIIVPDAERYMAAYVHRSREEFDALGWDVDHLPEDLQTTAQLVNHVFHQGGEHCFGWDFETMEWALRKAGFDKVIRQTYGVSRDAELGIDQANHAPYSLYVEAVK